MQVILTAEKINDKILQSALKNNAHQANPCKQLMPGWLLQCIVIYPALVCRKTKKIKNKQIKF